MVNINEKIAGLILKNSDLIVNNFKLMSDIFNDESICDDIDLSADSAVKSLMDIYEHLRAAIDILIGMTNLKN